MFLDAYIGTVEFTDSFDSKYQFAIQCQMLCRQLERVCGCFCIPHMKHFTVKSRCLLPSVKEMRYNV